MNMKEIIVLLLIAILVVQPIPSLIAEQPEKEKDLTKIIELLRKGVEKMRQIAEKINNTKIKEELLTAAEKIDTLLDEAEQLIEEGKQEEAEEKIREAMRILRDTYRKLKNKGKLRKLTLYIQKIRRLQRIIDRLKKIAIALKDRGANTTQAIILLEEAEFDLNEAKQLLKQRKINESIKSYLEAKRKTEQAARIIREEGEEQIKERITELLEKLKQAINKTINEIEKYNPELAEELREKAEKQLQEIEELINQGKYREALRKMRNLLGELNKIRRKIIIARRLHRLAELARHVAQKINETDPETASRLMTLADELDNALRSGDIEGAKTTAREIISILKELRKSRGE